MRRTLIVTNDFPPRQGGIQSFVHELALRLDPDKLTVYAPKWEGDAAFDAAQPFEVVRHPTSLMIGGPGVRRRAAELARSRRARICWHNKKKRGRCPRTTAISSRSRDRC